MRSRIGIVAIACMVLFGLGQPAFAEIAISLTGGTAAPMGATTNHGWRFTANENITLTELGLWDDDNDGMDIDHPIGIWRFDTAQLLTSGVISAGTGDTLVNHFRYVDVPDVPLLAGVDYVLGFYTPSANEDEMVYASPTDWWANPAITYVEARYGGNNSLLMPGPNTTTTYYRVGPNFQFVPEPGTMGVLLVAGLMLIRRR